MVMHQAANRVLPVCSGNNVPFQICNGKAKRISPDTKHGKEVNKPKILLLILRWFLSNGYLDGKNIHHSIVWFWLISNEQ